MYQKIVDSRQRYTMMCLFDSFLAALETHPVSDITVSQICENAGISRKTFYKYYSDQFGLLLAMQDDLFVGFQETLQNLPVNVFDITPELIRFANENRVLLKAAFENRGTDNFIDRVIDYLYDAYHVAWEGLNPKMSKKDVEFLFYYVTSGLVGIIRHWLFENPDMTPDEVIEQSNYLITLSTPEN